MIIVVKVMLGHVQKEDEQISKLSEAEQEKLKTTLVINWGKYRRLALTIETLQRKASDESTTLFERI